MLNNSLEKLHLESSRTPSTTVASTSSSPNVSLSSSPDKVYHQAQQHNPGKLLYGLEAVSKICSIQTNLIKAIEEKKCLPDKATNDKFIDLTGDALTEFFDLQALYTEHFETLCRNHKQNQINS